MGETPKELFTKADTSVKYKIQEMLLSMHPRMQTEPPGTVSYSLEKLIEKAHVGQAVKQQELTGLLKGKSGATTLGSSGSSL